MAENYKLELDTSQMTHSTATLDGNTINLNADTVGTDTFTIILKDENDEVLDTTTGVVNVVKTSLTVDSTASVDVGEVITVLGTVENLSPLCAVWGEITGNGTAPLLTINKVSDTTINYIIDATNADAGTYTLRTNVRQDNVDFTTVQICELTVIGGEAAHIVWKPSLSQELKDPCFVKVYNSGSHFDARFGLVNTETGENVPAGQLSNYVYELLGINGETVDSGTCGIYSGSGNMYVGSNTIKDYLKELTQEQVEMCTLTVSVDWDNITYSTTENITYYPQWPLP